MSVFEQTLRYEPLCEEHVSRLLAIEHEAYPDPWTPGMFRQEMINRTSHFFVAFTGGELVGYAGFWLLVDEIHITKVTVAAPFRGQGYGRELMEHLFAHGRRLNATSVRLEVRESNEPARRLYDSLGFEHVGLRAGYYARTGEAAVVMVRAITPGEGPPA